MTSVTSATEHWNNWAGMTSKLEGFDFLLVARTKMDAALDKLTNEYTFESVDKRFIGILSSMKMPFLSSHQIILFEMR